jgi:hypothetical protein
MKLHLALVALVAVLSAANAQEMVSNTSATHQLQTNMFSADTAGLLLYGRRSCIQRNCFLHRMAGYILESFATYVQGSARIWVQSFLASVS